MNTTVEIALPGISCINCVKPLSDILKQTKNELALESFFIDIPNKILHANFNSWNDRTLRTLTDTIDKFGIEWAIMTEPPRSAPEASAKTRVSTLSQKLSHFLLHSHWLFATLGLLSGLGLLAFSLSGVVLSSSAVIALTSASVLLTAVIGAPSFYHAGQKLWKQGSLTMDTLFSLSALVITSVSVTALFIPGLPMMIEAGLLIFGFRHLGQGIEERLIKKANGTRRFQDRLPHSVDKIDGQHVIPVSLNSIQRGDTIHITPGDIIPVDGQLISSKGSIIDTLKSGSILPRTVRKDQLLYSGFYLANTSDPITLRVTQTAAHSYLARMDQQLIAAQTEKAPIERLTDRLLQYFIPAVLFLSLCSGVALSFFFPLAMAIKCAAAVLVSACPCTLGLIIPLGVKVGIKKALEFGVEFKNPQALEKASTIDCIVFDLNGSLTQGKPTVVEFHHYDTVLPPEYCKSITRLLENHSSHPIARALMRFCQSAEQPSIADIPTIKPIAGGLSATLMMDQQEHHYHLGNQHCMETLGIPLPAEKNPSFPGQQRIYLARDKQIISSYTITDPLREQAVVTIKQLQKKGIDVHLCTGADAHTARGYARLLSIPAANVAANCIPVDDGSETQTKSQYIQSLKKEGKKVAMLGDAGNDSLALSDSDFGIAIGSEASDAITRENADALITENHCLPVLHCFNIAQNTMSNIKQNLYFSLAYNSAALVLTSGLLLTIGISLNPAIGAGLMVLQTSLILLNVYRFSQQTPPHNAIERTIQPQSHPYLYSLGVSHHLQTNSNPLSINDCSIIKSSTPVPLTCAKPSQPDVENQPTSMTI